MRDKTTGKENNGNKAVNLKGAPAAILAVLLLYTVFYFVGIGCPIKYVTGISCGGCGMTRAYLSLLHLDFAGAFHYHPLFFLPPVFLLLVVLKSRISSSLYKVLMFTIIGAFLIIYLLRLFDPTDTVVVFSPGKGLIYRISDNIVSLLEEEVLNVLQ